MRFSVLGMLLCAAPCAAATLFVDAAATPPGDGMAWSTAFVDLQDALDAARLDASFTEIHVAEGAYRPDRGTLDRTASFTLIDGVVLLGGFPSGGVGPRDPALHPAVLHGDLLGDDTPPDEFGFLNFVNDNSNHVVTALSCGESTILDGFTIRGGNANEGFSDTSSGGNVWIVGGGPTVRDCVIERGRATWGGGGVGAIDAAPTVENCLFRENLTAYVGGGMAIMETTSGIIRGCRFERNTGGSGVGVYCGPLRPDGIGNDTLIEDCEFIGGRTPIGATSGGGVHIRKGNPMIVGCRFVDNDADGGGGVGIFFGSARIERCVFLGNRGDGDGGGAMAIIATDPTEPKYLVSVVSTLIAGNNGGLVASNTSVELTNCTIVHNVLPDTPSFLIWPAILTHAPCTLTNTIVWGNLDFDQTGGARAFLVGGTLYEVHDSIIEGWDGSLAGDALAAAPDFVDSNGLDGDRLTPYDNNYRLRLGSPAVDMGSNGAASVGPVGLVGPVRPIGPVEASFDVEGRPRILDGDGDSVAIVDMGAYERCFVDINGDGLTDLADATALVEAVQGPFAMSAGGDLDLDGDTDLFDFALLQRFLPAGCQ
jgi:hypothetical protein